MTLRYFAPQPTSWPERIPDPSRPPHPLAQRAARELRAEIDQLELSLHAPGGGKMFGVLVVASRDGRVGYLRAFSGMLGGRWLVDGFVGPVFDPAERDPWWPQTERTLGALTERIQAAAHDAQAARLQLAAVDDAHALARAAMQARHRENQRTRRAARAMTTEPHALDQQSRGDSAARRALVLAQRAERDPLQRRARETAEHLAELERDRSDLSRQSLRRIQAGYRFGNAHNEYRSLAELFAPAEPPGGAGDCAAPKLLAHAARHDLRPLALAELWIGTPPATGGRHDGSFYPPCRGKCAPIVAHALSGHAVEPAGSFASEGIAHDEPRVVHDDPWLVVVDKPSGLLSVPGRGDARVDSVLTRLRERYPAATGPLLVHRLDLDASGLLLAAKTPAAHRALQQAFARHEIVKRYVAWLDGIVAATQGVIELPLRVDLDDRPRQIVDPIHGKPAVTRWRVCARTTTRTKVELMPRSGRTHQLRVHMAHPQGLDAPIIGDRLYGRRVEPSRLLLHAEALEFRHPGTGELVTLHSPAPFA